MIKHLSALVILCMSMLTAWSQPVWIDTDLAQDDWLALIYLIQQPEIEIKAITVAGDGVNDCAHGIPQLKYFLKKMQHSDIPFACGASKPLEGGYTFPSAWREAAFRFYDIAEITPDYSVQNQAEKIIFQALSHSQEPLLLISLAPMTNIAQFYLMHPKLFSEKISGNYFTGGAFHTETHIVDKIPESENEVSSWNTFIDPKASQIILNAAKPRFFAFVTENATRPLDFSAAAIEKGLAQYPMNPKIEFIRHAAAQKNDFFVADGVTALLVVHPKLCHWHGDHVVMLLEPAARRGETVFTCKGSPSIYCSYISESRFVQYYLQGLH